MKPFPTSAGLVIVTATILTSGCEDRDRTLARMAAEHARRQAEQNRQMAELQQEVARGSRALVEADARAREELIALERQVEAERAEVGRQRDELEAERRAIAARRRTDPVVAAALANLGIVLACLLPLVLCWYLLRQPPVHDDDQVVSELLIQEIVAEQPRLLLPARSRPLGLRAPDAGDDSDGEPGAEGQP